MLTFYFSEGVTIDKKLERLNLASNRLTVDGISSIVDAMRDHPKLVFLDVGFTKATTTIGEFGNLMGDEGAVKLAEFLKTNSVLRSLDVLHNNIGQTGLNGIFYFCD